MSTDVADSADSPPDTEHVVGTTVALRRAVRLAPALRRGLGVTIALAVLGAVGRLVVPVTLQVVIDRHVLSPAGIDLPVVAGIGAAALAVLVVAAFASRAAQVRMVSAAATGLCELRVMVFAHLHRLSLLHVESERRGALVARVTSDVQEVQQFLQWGGINLLLGAMRIALVLVAMAVYQWELAAVVVGLTACYAVVLRWFQRVLQQAYDRVRLRVADSMSAIGEAIAGLPTVRAYGAEQRTRSQLRRRLASQFTAEYRTHRNAAVLFSSAELFSALITVAVLLTGLLVVPDVSAGRLIAFLFLVNQFIEPVQMLVETLDQAQVAGSGVRRILGVLDLTPDLDGREDQQALPAGPLDVVARGVGFAYQPGRPVLHDVDLTIASGTRVAVVGETGSGKTTFAKLLVRLLRPSSGQITLGSVALDRVAADVLRDRVAFVPQEGFLFDGSVADNVRYGRPDADDRRIRQAVRDLDLDGWLATLPHELATTVGQRGGQLSAGERQLVALIRAWIADPDVLVLDEATSAVDPALDVQLRRAIERMTTGRTSITVAHRLATAESADLVVVFDGGHIVGTGVHDQLLSDNAVYRRLHADWATGTTVSATATSEPTALP